MTGDGGQEATFVDCAAANSRTPGNSQCQDTKRPGKEGQEALGVSRLVQFIEEPALGN